MNNQQMNNPQMSNQEMMNPMMNQQQLINNPIHHPMLNNPILFQQMQPTSSNNYSNFSSNDVDLRQLDRSGGRDFNTDFNFNNTNLRDQRRSFNQQMNQQPQFARRDQFELNSNNNNDRRRSNDRNNNERKGGNFKMMNKWDGSKHKRGINSNNSSNSPQPNKKMRKHQSF